MANLKITFNTKNLEKQLKKQYQDTQRKIKQEAIKQHRIEVAQTIVQNQPIIEG